MKAIITFEITKGKTVVIAEGTSGNIDRTNITGTEIEKKFVKLLKELSQYKVEQQVLDAIDINKWEEV